MNKILQFLHSIKNKIDKHDFGLAQYGLSDFGLAQYGLSEMFKPIIIFDSLKNVTELSSRSLL